ncbi:MAG: hypothetical protein ABUK01_05690 [Leptospirales bacterium]
MTIKHILLQFRFIVGILIVTMCSSNCNNDPLESSANSSSHNAGENCRSCHSSGSKLLTLAGTVYTTASSGTKAGGQGLTVKIKKNSKTLFTLDVDKSGNFYTDRDVNFSVQASVSNGNAMSANISKGGCNKSGCHTSGSRIY